MKRFVRSVQKLKHSKLKTNRKVHQNEVQWKFTFQNGDRKVSKKFVSASDWKANKLTTEFLFTNMRNIECVYLQIKVWRFCLSRYFILVFSNLIKYKCYEILILSGQITIQLKNKFIKLKRSVFTLPSFHSNVI